MLIIFSCMYISKGFFLQYLTWTWRQREIELMHKNSRLKFRQKHPTPCTFCGTIIKTDMYRHMARRHLELAQLWRCPVSWCTVWRGTPQDLMDHILDGHNVPGEVSLEMLFPRWTVTQQLYAESLSAQHSGISNDYCSVRWGCRWSITIACTEWAGLMLYVSWEVLGAAARSLTGEHDQSDSGRAIRPCLPSGGIHDRPDGRVGCYALASGTSPATTRTDSGYACSDRALAYRAGPTDGGGSRGV